MGKKQHSKDRMFLTATEWATEWGGKKADPSVFCKKLPFDCCALSLRPVDDPVCTKEGIIFDIKNIVPYIKKHGHNPVTGTPMTLSDTFPITFHKNTNGEFICPVSFKTLTEHSHIVAIKPSGNVYLMDTIQNLNIKIKDLKDLLSGEPFTREDVIDIQNPSKIESRLISNFHHIKNQDEADKSDEGKEDDSNPSNANPLAKRVMDQLKSAEVKKVQETKQPKIQTAPSSSVGFQSSIMKKLEKEKQLVEDHNRLFKKDTNNMIPMSASFTSTGFEVQTVNRVIEDPNKIKPKKVKDNGYVQILTNLGPLNFELYCGKVPLACENFLTHCENKYYVGVIFHRVIKNFVAQGGDPTGKGTGGESIWGKHFDDEFNVGGGLSHSGRGILSMANSGPKTNGSQFFVTLKSAKHLDNKHTVFGKLVGGMDTLDLIEKVPTDEEDKPLEEIKIIGVNVYQNPFANYVSPEEIERKKEEERRKKEEESEVYGKWFSNPAPLSGAASGGVGKYLQPTATPVSTKPGPTKAAPAMATAAQQKKRPVEEEESPSAASKPKAPVPKTDYNRFGNW